MTTERRTWQCASCGFDHTPRCPTCHVIVTALEADAGRCSTCANPITTAIYTCPECQTERALRPPRLPIPSWRGRGLAIKGLQTTRFFVGIVQMAGLLMMAVSCSAAAGGSVPQEGGPSLGMLQAGGFLSFFLLIPVQVAIYKALKRISFGTIDVGDRRRWREGPRRK